MHILHKTCRVISTALLIFSLLFVTNLTALASPEPVPERIGAMMFGDRVIDIAYHLGIVPAAMSARCGVWPQCKNLKTASQILGCPKMLMAQKLRPVVSYLKQHGIKRVLVEKNSPTNLFMPEASSEKLAEILTAQPDLPNDVQVEYIDFGRGFEAAVIQTAEALNRVEQGKQLLDDYRQKLEKAQRTIARNRFAAKVVVLTGTLQHDTGKSFIRVEAPDGYSDRFLLNKLGTSNVANLLYRENSRPEKGYVTLRKLNRLLQARPEVILITGDALAVQKKLAEAVANNPSLRQVPAIAAGAIYSVPGYVDSSVVNYPNILLQWAYALKI